MPYGWYRALRELLPRRQALGGAILIGLVPGFVSIYAYFMNETLLLSLTGFAFWLTLRAWRKATLGAWTLACVVWTGAIFTRTIAVPMAVLCLGTLWLAQRGERFEKAIVAIISVLVLAVPAGLHSRSTLGFFAPFGNVYLSQIYSLSGNRNIALDVGSVGSWGFGSPSFYNPTYYPFSDWTTDRQGTVNVKIDLSRGRQTWIAERERVSQASTFTVWQRLAENFQYLLLAQSWPDNDPNSLSGFLSVWSRWLWPPVMLFVAWGALRRGFQGREWLLPACSLGLLAILAMQSTGIIEGRYRKPVDAVLLAAAIVQYVRMRRIPPQPMSRLP
jgi:hypothetical protein